MIQNQEKILSRTVLDQIIHSESGVACSGLSGSEKAYLLSRIYNQHNKPVCVVTASPQQAEHFIQDLHFFTEKNKSVLLYLPPYNMLPFKFLSYHNETAANRIRTLYQLIENRDTPIVVTTVSALLQKLVPKQEICNYVELVMTDEDIDRDILIDKLVSGGYTRSAIVEEPGDFSIRGGILDIFTPLYPEPLRIELFGEKIESLRFFSPANQRTTRKISEAVILPAREAISNKERLSQIISRIRKQAAKQSLPVTKVRACINRIRNEGLFPGIESLIPLIYPKPGTIFDYLPDNTLFTLDEPETLEKEADELGKQAARNYATAIEEARLSAEPEQLYLKWPQVEEAFRQKKVLTLKTLPVTRQPNATNSSLNFDFSVKNTSDVGFELRRHREKGSLLQPLVKRINKHIQSGFITLLVCNSRKQVERLISLLEPYHLQPVAIDEFVETDSGRESVYVCRGRLSSGFIWADEYLAIITEDEIFGNKPRRKIGSRPKISAQAIPFEDLKKGDFIVHMDHGIGRYEGLTKLKLNGTENDFILIGYKGNDKLYLPVDRMSMVQKYMGVESIEPVLDRLGGASWNRVKKRVKKSVERIAGELLKLYAERKVGKGYAFSEAGGYFQDFEAGFPFEETEDQIKAIEAVMDDMAEPTPMDRLICGDVGYGKTEVALRASFVAVYNGKQVAVLVPTTVLAEQHYATFSNRFLNYPVNIACLSRFRSQREQRGIINDLKNGQIDIVVGTHRLLQRDVFFKDLGLVVLDEEQRFGVKHKEKLKKIRSAVDVLALTATPIPRTLYMSLMGIRDISIISTPPEQRHPIMTYIAEFDDTLIRAAIQKELGRNGQLFFVHNSIERIESVANYLQRLVPEVRLGVAHGRMSEHDLEKVMLQFVRKEIDMLVCTTIIESGLDIPSANTILVNRADKFGLAQMYQLRGRVGRADEQAYAYLFIPAESSLGKDAQKRLKVLMEHSDLGSGFQIAMNDLKIRGGGTILGASQSGHIAAVGYEMFLKLMESTISELKGEPVYENLEPEINIKISAFIPEAYIPDIDQRLTAYRRLVKTTDMEEMNDFKLELQDRYGGLPVEASNLFLKFMIKVFCVQAGVKKIDLHNHLLSIYFSEVHQKNPFGIVDLIHEKKGRYRFTPEHVLKVTLAEKNTREALAEIKNILKDITQHVNG